jgi:pteridine reductase
LNHKVVLITGGAKRIGAVMASTLHAQGMNILIHYRHSEEAAENLSARLNQQRSHSAAIVYADLNKTEELNNLINKAQQEWGRLDALINNASSFYPTPVGEVNEEQWEDLFASNLKAPFFLAQAAAPLLKQHRGCIINIVDIHAEKPLKNYPVYCMAKAGLVMMTKSLAKELAPDVRVNGIAPGNILWPSEENDLPEHIRQDITQRIALKRQGKPEEIAQAASFLIDSADYVTGHILAVDGGRLLNC